jgi:HAD superfamily hydrolase (TIGR01450 family)
MRGCGNVRISRAAVRAGVEVEGVSVVGVAVAGGVDVVIGGRGVDSRPGYRSGAHEAIAESATRIADRHLTHSSYYVKANNESRARIWGVWSIRDSSISGTSSIRLPAMPRSVSMRELASLHGAILLDAYGVLVDAHGALCGAAALVARFNQEKKPYFVVTNDASRLPGTLASRFCGFGLSIPEERIVSSGDLLPGYFANKRLLGKKCIVLGPRDSEELVKIAGGIVVEREPFDAVLVCDESGFDFLPRVDAVLSMLIRTLDAGARPALVVPNPDLIYPSKEGAFGLAAGSIAAVLEGALAQRYGARAPRFERLGKPHAPIFEEACRRAGTRDVVMVGDQLETDIRGANDFGIASALLGSGIARLDAAAGALTPTYVLGSLD